METSQRFVRPIVYAASIIFAVGAYYAAESYPASLRLIRLEEFYGFISAAYVYLALITTPVFALWPDTLGKGTAFHARRAIGISAFCFALLHSVMAIIGPLDGVKGLAFLEGSYLVSILAAAAALVILFLMAATSFDIAVRLMGPWWKRLHRFVYLAGLLIVIHVALIGAHFSDPDSFVAAFWYGALFLLLILEALRLDEAHFVKRAGYAPRFSWGGILAVIIVALLYMYLSLHGLSLHHH